MYFVGLCFAINMSFAWNIAWFGMKRDVPPYARHRVTGFWRSDLWGMYKYLPSHTLYLIKCVHTQMHILYVLYICIYNIQLWIIDIYIHIPACILIFPPPTTIRITYLARKHSGRQAPVIDAHKQALSCHFASHNPSGADECKASGYKRTCFFFYSCHVRGLYFGQIYPHI